MKKNHLFLFCLYFSIFLLFLNTSQLTAQVAINYDGSSPAKHTILDVNSDTTGMLIPRMTSDQMKDLADKLDSSHKGMLVYLTDDDMMCSWNGTEFEEVASGSVIRLSDYDNDTYIHVNLGTDPDSIVFATGGTEYWSFKDGRLKVMNTGGSVFIGNFAGASDDLSANKNVFVGEKSGFSTSTGTYNTVIGYMANSANTDGDDNTIIGYLAAQNQTLGDRNTIIGSKAGQTATGTRSGCVFLGYDAGVYETGSNKLYIHNSSSTFPLIYGDFASSILGFNGKVGIRTQNPLADLHVSAPDDMASIMITPNNTSSGGNSEILFAEDDDYTYGMFVRYDGAANKLNFYGKSNSTIYGPHLTITRGGWIGIGTGNPNDLFHVVSTGDNRTAYFQGEGTGTDDAVLYSANSNISGGYAGYFETNGSSATVVLQQNGAGEFLEAFGPNGGSEEMKIYNDGAIDIFNSNHNRTIRIDPSETGTDDGGQITLYNAGGTTATIEIDGSYGGDGRITTNELQITGGSDLSEYFDLTDHDVIQKGMVVSIDENNPGHLKISQMAYDKKVAGIVSGANNIESGLIMSQKGTIADGEHLIALSGRVYCLADATGHPIEIGDMLTTSGVPGYAMKVTDFEKARGAVIGKAMTSLKSGKGLVLILVSLQ